MSFRSTWDVLQGTDFYLAKPYVCFSSENSFFCLCILTCSSIDAFVATLYEKSGILTSRPPQTLSQGCMGVVLIAWLLISKAEFDFRRRKRLIFCCTQLKKKRKRKKAQLEVRRFNRSKRGAVRSCTSHKTCQKNENDKGRKPFQWRPVHTSNNNKKERTFYGCLNTMESIFCTRCSRVCGIWTSMKSMISAYIEHERIRESPESVPLWPRKLTHLLKHLVEAAPKQTESIRHFWFTRSTTLRLHKHAPGTL